MTDQHPTINEKLTQAGYSYRVPAEEHAFGSYEVFHRESGKIVGVMSPKAMKAFAEAKLSAEPEPTP